MKDIVVDNIIRSQVVEDYLDFFENKDLDGITDLLAESCSLTDWSVGLVEGKENVLEIFSNIFDSFEKIEANISHLHEDVTGILTCEMILTLDDQELLVADIFEFDDDDRIQALRAYKGN
tara:strand:+ start:6412 stop:6771 length:360 start_codon:yes stop_codon:yes gene_type:complete